MALTMAVVLQTLGAGLVVALGVAVAWVKPRTRANAWFALFAVAFGGQFVITNIGAALDVVGTELWYTGGRFLVRVAAVVGAVAVGLTFPRGVSREERRAVALAGAWAGSLFLVTVVGYGVAVATWERVLADLATMAFVAVMASLHFLLYIFAGRYAANRDDPVARGQFVLMSAALLLYVGFIAGAGSQMARSETIFSGNPFMAMGVGIFLFSTVALAVWWLVNASRAADPRPPRNVALLALATPLAGMLHLLYLPNYGALGIVRTLAVAVLTYAILQRQLLGIDVKVRWGVSRSTVAAVFVGVFFVVSEAAQQFFGETLGSQYVGIIAAGMLVFAIAPLQRVADRLAERAVPVEPVAPVAPALGGARAGRAGRAARFQAAARLALRDHRLTREEERTLLLLAEDLGIPMEEAMAMLDEAHPDL